MRTFDFTPYYRATVGFDRLFDLLDNTARSDWPPYNIEKTGEQAYRITLAVAGFSLDDITVTARPNELVVTGKHARKIDGRLRRGIFSQSFERRFDLDDHVEVTSASLANGLLTIDLRPPPPMAVKPRTIEIKGKSPKRTLIEQVRQATTSARDAVVRWFARSCSLRSAA